MKTRDLVIGAGGSVHDFEGGNTFILQSLSAGGEIAVTWIDDGGLQVGTVRHVQAGEKYKPGFRFSGYVIAGTAGAAVVTIIAEGDADIDTAEAVVTVSGTVAVSGPLTDAQLRAVAVPVSGPVTDAQLRAAAVPVSGPVTDAQLRAAAVPVSGPVTDAQLRAAAVPVSGPVTDAQLRAAAVPVSGPLTDAQLRAATVPVQDTRPAAIANVAPVAATAVIAALLAVNAARRGFYARNVGADAVALVGAAGTFANAAIVVLPGETWVETNAPGAAWYAICDAGLTATVNLLTW